MRWIKSVVKRNDGGKLALYASGKYVYSQNLNEGSRGWWFEVEHAGRGVGKAPTARKAEQLAAAHQAMEASGD